MTCEILAWEPKDPLFTDWNQWHKSCALDVVNPTNFSAPVAPIDLELAKRCVKQLSFNLFGTFPHGFLFRTYVADFQIVTDGFATDGDTNVFCELALNVTRAPPMAPVFVGSEIYQHFEKVFSIENPPDLFNAFSGQMCTLAPDTPNLADNETHFDWSIYFYGKPGQ
ncbi:hypothetical protein HD806DRAFT_529596 [Xylariaceae sp. AK1471]|nr:hypothetical protein HD806DRAFT_529596 [Xylariaceae sp. AK1471]